MYNLFNKFIRKDFSNIIIAVFILLAVIGWIGSGQIINVKAQDESSKSTEQTKPEEKIILNNEDEVLCDLLVVGIGVTPNINLLLHILEFCRNYLLKINIYNSCSTDCFGKNKKVFCNEKTTFNPQSPYARSKAFSF